MGEQSSNRRVLLVSLNFPPSSVAGVHRARHMAKALPAYGWTPRVLTVDERYHKEPPDPALARLVPPSVDVVRIKAIPVGLGKLFGIGDLGLRAMPFLRRELDRQIQSFRPAVVFFTGWPFYDMLLARRVRRMGIPVVIDFQDPWVSAEGGRQPFLSKAGLSHFLATQLEPHAVRSASFITSVSARQNEEMASRYDFLNATHMSAIPIGGDPDDFTALQVAPPPSIGHALDPNFINISYVGTLLPRAQVTMRTLLAAVSSLRARNSRLAEQVRFNFVGTSNQLTAIDEALVMPLARAEGVADLAVETSRRLPYVEALSILAKSRGLLLVGSDEPHYTASKIYPALMSQKPYVSLFHTASSAHQILTEAGGGATFAFESHSNLPDLVGPISEALERLATNPESFGKPDARTYTAYTAAGVAKSYADIFERLAFVQGAASP